MTSPNLAHLALSDNGFLFDTATGFTYTLNKVGTLVLKGIIDGEDREEIVLAITDRFEVESKIASKDMEQFLSRLNELGLGEPGLSESD